MGRILVAVFLSALASIVSGDAGGKYGVTMEISGETDSSIMGKRHELFQSLADSLHEHCNMKEYKHECCGMVDMEYEGLSAPNFLFSTQYHFDIDKFYAASENSVRFRVVGKYNVEHLENHCSGFKPGHISDHEGKEEYLDQKLLMSVVNYAKPGMEEKHKLQVVDVYTDDSWGVWQYIFLAVIGAAVVIGLLILLAVGMSACRRNSRANREKLYMADMAMAEESPVGYTNQGVQIPIGAAAATMPPAYRRTHSSPEQQSQSLYPYLGASSRHRNGPTVYGPQGSNILRQPYYSWM